MALIKCVECEREISDKAASCPNCGIPLTLQENNLPSLAPASYSLNNLANNEYSFFQEGPINITNMRAIFRNKTFAMANITSVSMGEVPPKRIYGVIAIIIGLIFTLEAPNRDEKYVAKSRFVTYFIG